VTRPSPARATTTRSSIGILTSAHLKVASYRLQPGAAFTAESRAIYIVLSGSGSVDGNGYRKLSTVYLEDGEQARFTADEVTELVQFGLPTLDQIATEPPAPRIESDEETYAIA
jgi:hypothetical protein